MRVLAPNLETERVQSILSSKPNPTFLARKVSLDTLRPDRFAAITRRKGLDAVLASLDAALAHGYGGR